MFNLIFLAGHPQSKAAILHIAVAKSTDLKGTFFRTRIVEPLKNYNSHSFGLLTQKRHAKVNNKSNGKECMYSASYGEQNCIMGKIGLKMAEVFWTTFFQFLFHCSFCTICYILVISQIILYYYLIHY